MNTSVILIILLVVFVVFLAMNMNKGGLGAAAAITGGLGAIFGGAMRKGTKKGKRKFDPLGGPRDGLKVQKELELKQPKPLDQKTVDEAMSVINEKLSYGPLDESEKKSLEAGAKKLSVDPGFIIKMRHVATHQNIANKTSDVINNSTEIAKEHAGGKTIMQIAKDRNLPPASIARQILLGKGYDIKTIRSMFQGETPPPEDMVAQLKEVEANDYTSHSNIKKIYADADKFKAKVAAWLDKNKVKYKTADDLKKEQIADPKYGRPIATPDFFFMEPIKINGNLVNWLSTKDFPLFKTERMQIGGRDSKMLKQMAYAVMKYNKNFGRGAFIFSEGVQQGVELATKQGPVDVDLLTGL